MSHLPTELYRDIIENVTSRRDLYTLLLTSSPLRHEAERVLLREIDMRPHVGEIDRKPSIVQQFELIRRSPDLASVVHRLVYYRHVLKEELVFAVIPLMNKIRHLCFATQPHPVFNTCSLQLTSFTFIAESLGRRTEILHWISHQMVPFLNSQHSLEEFSVLEPLSTNDPLDNLSSTSLSRLDTLTFHAGSALPYLLRGRRVRRLNTLHMYRLSLTDMMDHLKHLRVLVCGEMLWDSPSERSALAGVQYFQTNADYRRSVNPTSAMPRLKKLVLMTEGSGSHPLPENLNYIKELFDLQPSLKEIELREGNCKPRLRSPIVKKGVLYQRGKDVLRRTTISIDWDEWKRFPCESAAES